MTQQPSPGKIVEAMAQRARMVATRCGTGTMVWRVWGSGSPLVLVHGGSGSWTHWIRNIPVLERHFELWVPDLPGLGQSAMPPEPWVPATVARVALEGLDEALGDVGDLRVAGFSFGGHIAGLMARELGSRLRDLTLVGVAGLGLRADPRDERKFFRNRQRSNQIQVETLESDLTVEGAGGNGRCCKAKPAEIKVAGLDGNVSVQLVTTKQFEGCVALVTHDRRGREARPQQIGRNICLIDLCPGLASRQAKIRVGPFLRKNRAREERPEAGQSERLKGFG